MSDTTMEARDALSSKISKGICWQLVETVICSFRQKSFEATFTKNKKTVDILGRPAQGNKASGWSGKFKLVIYHNTELFNEMFTKYKNTGRRYILRFAGN